MTCSAPPSLMPTAKLIGRLTIDEIVDVVYEETDNDLRRMGGLSDEEDVFARSAKR
ncbi:magnesium transporter [Klebsiella pneumoniae]|uniref:Magnesium transporter n=1 Tax=Klebsiella pneumoniae TaxID=573 RepID=A0A3S4KDX7_KLEPN|nr:magnesium transporter [Klebsiella pneumoniae]